MPSYMYLTMLNLCGLKQLPNVLNAFPIQNAMLMIPIQFPQCLYAHLDFDISFLLGDDSGV